MENNMEQLTREQFMQLREKGLSLQQIIKFAGGGQPEPQQPQISRIQQFGPAESQTTFQEADGFLGKTAGFLGRATGVEEIGRSIGRTLSGTGKQFEETQAQQRGTSQGLIDLFRRLPEGKQKERVRRMLVQQGTNIGQIAQEQESATTAGLTGRDIVASGARTALTLGTAGLGAAPTVAGRIGAGAALGAGFGATNAIQRSNNVGQALKEIALGGAIGGVTAGAVEGGRVLIQKGIPRLLSYTSGTPHSVLARSFEEPAKSASGLAQAKLDPTGLNTRGNLVNAGFSLKQQANQQYDDALNAISQRFDGTRFGLNSSQQKILIADIAKFIPEESIPQNINSMSFREAMNLYKGVNTLMSKKAIREGAEGIVVKSFRDNLKNALRSNFGGTNGPVDEMLNNYAAKVTTFNAIDDIVAFDATKKIAGQGTESSRAGGIAVREFIAKPKKLNAALNNLTKVGQDNKVAFLDSIIDLEDALKLDRGNLLDPVLQRAVLPRLGTTNVFGGNFMDRIIGAMGSAVGVGSPRLSGFGARQLGTLTQLAEQTGMKPALRAMLISNLTQKFGDKFKEKK